MSTIDLDAIVGNLDRCVLILGPDTALNDNGTPLVQALHTFLVDEAKLSISRTSDDLFVFSDKPSRMKVQSKSRDFYKLHGKSNDLHLQLAQMQFPLIISTTPDLLLRRAFDTQGITCDFHFYNKVSNPRPVEPPNVRTPLVYNLFGCVEEPDSLIFEQDDLFEFLFAILGDRRLPRELTAFTERAQGVVFLGFDFDKWYFKLLLKLLFPNRDKYYSMMLADAQERYGSHLHSFYANIFDIEYIDSGLPAFVQALYADCAQRGLLRETATREESPIKKRVRSLISVGEIQEAIQELEIHLDTLPNADDDAAALSVIAGEYNRLRRKIAANSIPAADATTQTNGIASRLQDFTATLE